jgi:F-type H+-transporting ATP synthase subunit e
LHSEISQKTTLSSGFANNTLLQVLRYSALGAGIFYGLYHQAKLSTSAKLAAVNREYEHKQSLIEKAKAEYTKKNQPSSQKTEGGGGMFDPISCFGVQAEYFP